MLVLTSSKIINVLLIYKFIIRYISDIPYKKKPIIMGDSDRHIKMEIDYSSVVDQKLKECDELMKVNINYQMNT